MLSLIGLLKGTAWPEEYKSDHYKQYGVMRGGIGGNDW